MIIVNNIPSVLFSGNWKRLIRGVLYFVAPLSQTKMYSETEIMIAFWVAILSVKRYTDCILQFHVSSKNSNIQDHSVKIYAEL